MKTLGKSVKGPWWLQLVFAVPWVVAAGAVNGSPLFEVVMIALAASFVLNAIARWSWLRREDNDIV